MALTLEEYLIKHEELTRKEQENKVNHQTILYGIEHCHRQNQQKEMELYCELKRKENASYMDKVQDLQRQKRELKQQRLLTYQEELRALGKEGVI